MNGTIYRRRRTMTLLCCCATRSASAASMSTPVNSAQQALERLRTEAGGRGGTASRWPGCPASTSARSFGPYPDLPRSSSRQGWTRYRDRRIRAGAYDSSPSGEGRRLSNSRSARPRALSLSARSSASARRRTATIPSRHLVRAPDSRTIERIRSVSAATRRSRTGESGTVGALRARAAHLSPRRRSAVRGRQLRREAARSSRARVRSRPRAFTVRSARAQVCSFRPVRERSSSTRRRGCRSRCRSSSSAFCKSAGATGGVMRKCRSEAA